MEAEGDPPAARRPPEAAAADDDDDDDAGAAAAAAAAAAEREERLALGRVASALRWYLPHAEAEVARWEANAARLPAAHAALAPHLGAKAAAARAAARANARFVRALLAAHAPGARGAPPHMARAAAAADEWERAEAAARARRAAGGGGGGAPPPPPPPWALVSAADADKVRYVLKNAWRDWAVGAAPERAASYGRVLAELAALFPRPPGGWRGDSGGGGGGGEGGDEDCGGAAAGGGARPPRPRVLVPGAGLGRLVVEVAALGLDAVGNEFSYFMLLASSFLLNHSERAGQHAIHPWLHSCCNRVADADQLAASAVPDAPPAELLAAGAAARAGGAPGRLAMCAGDFAEVFGAAGGAEFAAAFDAVATVFFVDTAHNVLEYLDCVWRVLKPGGYWVNFGPLLYHWAAEQAPPRDPGDGGPPLSVELSLEAVEAAGAARGFEPVRRGVGLEAGYMSDPTSMMASAYRCAFWTWRKPLGAAD